MPESLQHKLDRVRPPRVQITYDVETAGAIQKKELPFVVGILADLSGKPAQADHVATIVVDALIAAHSSVATTARKLPLRTART